MVVEVALGGRHLELLGQYTRDKLLGGSLSVAAGYGYNWYRQATTMLACQRLQCLQGVVHQKESFGIVGVRLKNIFAVDDCSRCSLLESGYCIVVAIERCSVQCKKERTDFDLSRVGGYARRVSKCGV